mgnify:CR=1 FL=1
MNPKCAQSGIVTCRPQADLCRLNCPNCYQHKPNYYESLEWSNFPSPEEAAGKLVRVNDSNDSNNGGVISLPKGHWLLADHPLYEYGCFRPREALIALVADLYEHPFWNTSLPRFDFPGPVIFTANGRQPLYVDCPANVMAVRIRCNSWEWSTLWTLANHYMAQGVPVLLTPMRYYDVQDIPQGERIHYQQRKHILNESWQLADNAQLDLRRKLAHVLGSRGVQLLMCHGLCKDCGNCEKLFWQCLDRMDTESKPQEDVAGLCTIGD